MMAQISVEKAAAITGLGVSTVKNRIAEGKFLAVPIASANGGGVGGTTYRINIDSLPLEAQILYYQETAEKLVAHAGPGLDLAGYKAREGEAGMAELLRRQKAALAAIGMRQRYKEFRYTGFTRDLQALADGLKVPLTTLLRWEKQYTEAGLAGLIRKPREDKGEQRSMCLLTRDYIEFPLTQTVSINCTVSGVTTTGFRAHSSANANCRWLAVWAG